MNRQLMDVKEFCELMGTPKGRYSPVQNERLASLSNLLHQRIGFLQEELAELSQSVVRQDASGLMDALVDLEYFLLGTWCVLGIDDIHDEAFHIVHKANMLKRAGRTNRGQDAVKPDGWRAPDLPKVPKDSWLDDWSN